MELNLYQILENRIEEVNNALQDNPGWVKTYENRANEILKVKNSSNNKIKPLLDKRLGLSLYVNHSKAKGNNGKTKRYDVRFSGQSVAEIIMRKTQSKTGDTWESFIRTSLNQIKNNEKYFKIKKDLSKEISLKSKEAKAFMSSFNKINSEQLHSPEHSMEHHLLIQFAKERRSQHKPLCNVQSVKLDGAFFQFVTPFKASTKKHEFSKKFKGGGIDILARCKSKDNNFEHPLIVFELKDEPGEKEHPCKVIQQAITYAAFIGNLLTNEKIGEKWWNIFGYDKKPKFIKLIACTLMPLSNKKENNGHGLESQTIKINDNISVEIHSLFFNKQKNEFSGSLLNIIKE